MSDIDLAKVKRNVATMAEKGAPQTDIDGYIKQSGTTVDAVRDFKTEPESDAEYFKKNTYAGNMVTGAQESGVDIMKGARWVGEKLYGPNAHDEAEKEAFKAADKKLESQEGPGIGNAIARFGGDPLNYVGGAAVKEGKVVEKIGEKLAEKAENVSTNHRAAFIKDLVSPKQTKAVREAQVGRTTEKGLLKTKTVEPTSLEKEVAEEVNKLPVHGRQSLQANYNVISKANSAEAERLQSALKARHIPVSMDEVQEASNKLIGDLKKNIYITGQGEPIAKKVVGIMQEKVLQNATKDGEITAANLLQARKEFDAEIKAQKTAKIFDSSTEGPASIAIQKTRQALNDLIESKVPGEYKVSLKKQSLLYRAMDNLEEKAANERGNVVSRAVDKYKKYAVPAGVGAIGYGAAKALGATTDPLSGKP